jgi:hypothetical protein
MLLAIECFPPLTAAQLPTVDRTAQDVIASSIAIWAYPPISVKSHPHAKIMVDALHHPADRGSQIAMGINRLPA